MAEKKKTPPSQTTVLLELVEAESPRLIRSPEEKTFAVVCVNGVEQTIRLRSGAGRDWLTYLFLRARDRAPSAQAIADVTATLDARARFDGEDEPVFVRIGEKGGRIYVDLGDPTWDAVEIGPAGWRIVNPCPVRFRRPKGLLPQARPARGGSWEELRRFLHLGGDDAAAPTVTGPSSIPHGDSLANDDGDACDDTWRLFSGWVTAAYQTRGPYPILVVTGEAGSAKSTTSKVARRLVDPAVAPLRSLPKDTRDLFVRAGGCHVLGFDNLSGMAPEMSDALCTLATGGGFATRANYTDDEEAIFDACKPMVANGIDDVATRPDLADRSIVVALERIPDDKRKPETQFWSDFDAALPRILGALFDVIATAIRNRPNVHLAELPRMADVALWVTAAESGFGWPSGAFVAAYKRQRVGAMGVIVDGDAVASAIRNVVAAAPRERWEGTASELLEAINAKVPEVKRPKTWPGGANALSRRLRRMAPALRAVGVNVESRRSGEARSLSLSLEKKSGSSSQPSPVDESPLFSRANRGDDNDDDRVTIRPSSSAEVARLVERLRRENPAMGQDEAEAIARDAAGCEAAE